MTAKNTSAKDTLFYSTEYLLNLQQMIKERKNKFDLLCSKEDVKNKLEFEINKLSNEIEELDRRIAVSTIK